MAIEWYYRTEEGQEQGPVNSSQLKRLADFGKVQPTTQVRLAQGDRWEPAAQVDGLFPAGAAKLVPSPTLASAAPQPSPLPAYQPAHEQSVLQPPAYQQPPVVPTVLSPGLEWYCHVSGRMLGPLRVEELRDLARLGRVEPISLIARGASGPWFPAIQMAAGLGLAWPQLQAASGYGQPMMAPMPMGQPLMHAAGYEYAEPEDDTPVVAPVHSARTARLSDMPRSNPMFLVILGGTLAIVVIGVAVTSFIVSQGKRPLARTPAVVERQSDSATHDAVIDPQPLIARDAPISATGLNGRPKERGDRFQAFATQAAETKWVPEADPKLQADIAAREKRVGELLVEMSVDFVTEPLEADFKQLQTQYRTGSLTPQAYLESLDAVQKVLRRAMKGGKP